MKPLLVGEVNPLSDRPEHALYPWPPNCSGERLQRLVLGVPRAAYLRDFGRVDLCVGKWSIRTARAEAARLDREWAGGAPFVLLGAKVAEAFGVDFLPFEVATARGRRLLVLPHPSGLCRLWQQPGAYLRARDALQRAGVLAAP